MLSTYLLINVQCPILWLTLVLPTHGVLFIFGLWEIWLARNAFVFENSVFNPTVGNPKIIAGAGVIRDADGNWVNGFTEFIGEGNSLMAELWAICEGLKLAKHLGRNKFIFEIDSLAAVKLISNNNCGHLYQYLATWFAFTELSFWVSLKAVVRHIHREGNACADRMARQAILEESPMK
ncbi:reverse transcriptase [Senna tora]|uniref:Reverse transcriptase n=1 Tax=Senna tora TaxID=362788 RepID=A0A834X5Z0_9FABA|nr:reverse transcriptase [Senna tora]